LTAALWTTPYEDALVPADSGVVSSNLVAPGATTHAAVVTSDLDDPRHLGDAFGKRLAVIAL
jgi:hypothetical protein